MSYSRQIWFLVAHMLRIMHPSIMRDLDISGVTACLSASPSDAGIVLKLMTVGSRAFNHYTR